MEKRKTFTNVLSGVLVGGLLFSGGLAFADNVQSTGLDETVQKAPFMRKVTDSGRVMHQKGHFGKGGPMLGQDTLDQLVKEIVISEDKANEIKNYLDKEFQDRKTQFEEFKNLSPEERKAIMEERKNPGSETKPIKQDIFEGMVEDKILTQDQADTIKEKIREIAQAERQQKIADDLTALVEKGTINQEQADKVLDKLHFNPINQLVEDGVLNQEQADAVAKAVHHKGFRGGRG